MGCEGPQKKKRKKKKKKNNSLFVCLFETKNQKRNKPEKNTKLQEGSQSSH